MYINIIITVICQDYGRNVYIIWLNLTYKISSKTNNGQPIKQEKNKERKVFLRRSLSLSLST